MFTDTHAHIYSEYYEDFDEVVNNAKDKNVNRIINAATNINNSLEVLEISKKYDTVYCCIGIHPEDIDTGYDNFEQILIDNLNNNKLVAIGEIGLDYYYSKDNKDKQKELFEYQLSLAEKYNLPVVVHSREATLDTIECLKKYNVRGVIHCFSGSIETAKIYIKMGFYIGVGGVLTFKNSKIDDVIKEIPLDRILLETDSPYLTPEPNRGKRNEPAYISDIAMYLAKLFNVELDEISSITENNVNTLYFKNSK